MSRRKWWWKMAMMSGGAITPFWLTGGIPSSMVIAAYQPVGASSVGASYVNLANPGVHDLTAPRGAPSWSSATGWAGDAILDSPSGKFLRTDFFPIQAMTVMVRYSDFVGFCFLGSLIANVDAERLMMTFGFGSNNLRGINGTNASAYKDVAGNTAGTFCISGRSLYVDGVYKAILNDSTPTQSNIPFYILAFNNNDPSGTSEARYYLNGKVQAVVFYNNTLDSPTIAALHTRMIGLPL